MNSPTPSTPSSGDSPPQVSVELAPQQPTAVVAVTTVAGPSPNNAKRRLPSGSVPYGSSNRRRREESMKEEKQREQEREGERGMADVELMKYLNSSGWDCDWLASDARLTLTTGFELGMSGADKSRRRGSVLSALRRTEKSRGSKSDKGRSSLDEHERLREAAARSTGLHSILPDLGDQDRPRHRPAGLDLRQIARDEAAAKLCGERESVPPLPLPLPTVPLFPCAHSALAAHTQLSGPLLKHQTPNTLARLVRTKPWKSRHAVFCTYALRNCSCAQPHRASVPSCDSATRTLACLHLFAAPTPDALELARLVVTEDRQPTLASDDSRRGPKDLDDRKAVFQVQGISGAPMHPPHDKPKRSLSRRRDSAGANTLKSATSHRPQTVASLGLHPSSSSANLVLGLDDDSRVHAVWFLQCPDADARQRWVSCIKRAVLLQRSANFISFAHVSSTDISMLFHFYSAERAGFGGTIHFTSPRSVTDPLPSADLDVVLAMRAQAHRSTVPYASPPVTPMATTFSPIAHFPPVSPPFVTSPTSPLSPGSEASHMDTISLGFARSQTPTYAPSVHTTATAPALIPHSKSRSRSLTVTNSAPVQALRGFFSRPPSRGANNRARTTSGTAAAASPTTTTGPNHLASFTAVNPTENGAYALGTPISAGLGSMDLSSAASTMAGVIDEPLGTPGPGPSTLPVLSSTGLPAPKPPAIAPMSKGIGSLPPPPRAKRAGSVSHVLARGDETVRGRDEEEGVRRPSLVPMLSLSFGRGDDVDREKASDSNDLDSRVQEDEKERVQGGEKDRARTDERDTTQHARILPPMLAPPSSPLPVPPGPGASRSSLQLPGVGVHATGSALALGLHHPTGSALALPPAMANLSPLSPPQPQSVLNSPPTALNLPPSSLNLPPITLATSASGPPQAHPHLPTLALRTVGSIPILPGSWPVSPNLTAITPSDGDGVTPSAITPSDVYTGGGNNPSDMYLARGDYQQGVAHGDYHGQVMTPSDYHHHHHYHAQATTPSAVTPSDTFGMSPSDPLGPYGFSPYRISMTSDAFRISIHSDAYQAAVSSPTSESYHTPPSAVSRSTPSQYSALTTPSVVLGGSYLSLAGRASEDEVALASVSVGHLPMGSATRLGSTTNAMPFTSTSHLAAAGSTSYLAGSSSHLVTASTSHLATTSTSHLDTSTSHLDLSETTHLPNSTPFTTDADSMYSVKVGQSSSDGRNGSDIFRSGSSHLDATRSNHSDTVRSNNSDAFKSNGRVSLAFGRGALHEYSGTDGWEAGDYHSGKSVRSGVGSARESQSQSQSHSVYTQSISVRESPTRTVATGSYRDREGSMRDRDPDSAPSSPSSQAENYVGPTGGLFGGVPRESFSPRESFGAPREPFGSRRDPFRVRRDSFGAVPSSSFSSSFMVSDDTAHPFSSTSPSQTPVKSTPSPGGRRGHRRAGSYAGPTLYTIASGSFSLDRRQSQRGNSDALPPAAPPPNVPLPPTPSTSRPSTPVSRPRTPSRQITSTPPVPPLPPPRSSLRTRLRMLSTPSTPEPVPRELGPPHEDELAQPISKVPMQMLVQEDSSSIRRAASEHGGPREGLQQHGGMGTSLPPPPRTRPMAIRQHSYSASASDRDGSSEGRRSDESGKRGHGARDSAVHLENRGSD
ncbi:hypothetical protein RHS03_02074, partial [Rhizoctonia solani]